MFDVNNNNDNSVNLVLSFFNQYLFNEAKTQIENIKYFYSTNVATSGNPLIEELLSAINTYSFDSIGEPLFRSILNKCKKTPQEIEQIMEIIIKWKNFNKEEIKPAKKYLDDVISAAVIKKAGKFNDSPSDYLKYLKDVNLETGDLETFSSTGFSKIDINTIVADSGRGVVSTNVRLLNDAFRPHNGIERGQLGIICCPPGVGKTLMAMNLACWMASNGEKVLYISCADMNWKDFIVRMASIAFGIPFADAYKNLPLAFEKLSELVKDNLEISINPAGKVSVDDIVDKAESGGFSVVFVDYDGVLAGVTEGDSMYNTFGDVYNKLTKLSIGGKLVFVCSQPKVFKYHELITLSDIGESSKKQQVADFIFTMSDPNPDCPNHLYIGSLPKARRGRVGSKAYYIRIEARFIEIPKGLYEQLKAETEEKNYTEQEIRIMIDNFNKTYNNVQADISKKTQSIGNMKTPF